MKSLRKPKKLPNFKSLEEEANFWDTHNVFDYATGENVKLVVDLKKPKEETIIFRIQSKFKKMLEKVAASQGIGTSTLVRMWMIEKLKEKCYNTR